MHLVIALIIGLLFSSSIFLMLHRSFFKLILGVIIFGYATIFFLFMVSGVQREQPPLLSEGTAQTATMADPLPQAMALTAIVIGIGVQLFVIALLKKVFEVRETDDLDSLRITDETG